MTIKNLFDKNNITGGESVSDTVVTFGEYVRVAYVSETRAFVIRLANGGLDVAWTTRDLVARVRRHLIDAIRDDLIVPTPDDYIEYALFGDDPDFYVDYQAGVVCHNLPVMPCDRWDDTCGFIHATGREYWDGCHWANEYEDDEP